MLGIREFSSTETVLALALEVALSGLRSPLKSSTVKDVGTEPTGKLIMVAKPPFPLPNNAETLSEPRLDVARLVHAS